MDVGFRSLEPAELAGIGLAEVGEDFRLAARGFDLFILIADAGQLAALGHHLAGKSQGAVAQLAFLHQGISQATVQGLLCRNVTTGGHHFQGALRADHTRQALGATGTWQQAQIDLRQTELGRRHRHTEVSTKGNL